MSRNERWHDRRIQAWIIRAVVFIVPVVVAIGVATIIASLLPEPSGFWQTIGWWVLVLGGSFVAMWLVDRFARKLLPLAALLRMSLVFPDKAPSRFSVALRSYSSKRMQAEVTQARAAGVDDDPTKAAEFVLALVASLGSHDRKTRGHAERTRAYTDLLAEELGVAETDRDRLRWAALLHDVGKLGVPAEVLNADHQLTEEDWSHLTHHPRDGYELTRPIHGFLGPWAATILHHHERYDGTGYPQGIAGEDIAYGARIVAVGDAYDAMTAHRTYQPALSTTVARRELAEGAGSQFDPTIVRAFLSLSMGSLRRIAGPLAFLGQIPFIGGIRRLGDTATAVAVTSGALAVTLVAGVIPGPGDATAAEPPIVVAAEANGAGGGGSPAETASAPTTTTTSSTTTTTTTLAPTTTQAPNPASPAPTTNTTTPTSTTTTTTTTTVPTSTTTTTLAPWFPTTVDDSVTTDEDVPIDIDVLANDSDRDGDLDPSTLAIDGAPSIGVAVASSGLVEYTPNADASGTDSFDYVVCDAGGRCSGATVDVTVTPVNDPPVARADSATGDPRTDVAIDVLANDTDIDGGPLSIASFDASSSGGGIVSCSATCIFTPPDPWASPDTFTYTVTDGNGGSDTATVTVTPTTADLEFFLQAGGSGNQTSTPVLPLSTNGTATNSSLPNYDTDRDGSPGLFIVQVPNGPPVQLSETDPAKFQLWSSAPLTGDLVLDGDATADLWAGMASLQAGVHGRIRIFVLDCPVSTVDGTDCTEIERDFVDRNPWTTVDGQWENADFDFGTISYTVPAGRTLTLKLTVAGPNADDDMRFAFDAVGFESSFVVRRN
ncbi:MAG: tandem-95 repeat protein [Acidimicrobiia bacterium]|nr:tandem-95 repeat protein [Acidimicrobiia bacterium]